MRDAQPSAVVGGGDRCVLSGFPSHFLCDELGSLVCDRNGFICSRNSSLQGDMGAFAICTRHRGSASCEGRGPSSTCPCPLKVFGLGFDSRLSFILLQSSAT